MKWEINVWFRYENLKVRNQLGPRHGSVSWGTVLKTVSLQFFIGLCQWCFSTAYNSVYQTPGRGPVPGPGTNYSGPREAW